MNKSLCVTLLLLFVVLNSEGKKLSRSRSSSSSRGSSRKTNAHPAPTSFSYPQATAPKPTLFGWQEKPVRSGQKPSNSNNNRGHSYPSSQTGLSGYSQPKQPPTYQESIQKSNVQQTPIRTAPQSQGSNQLSHSYPASSSLSGNSKPQATYPQQQGGGLSGSGVSHQQQHGAGVAGSGAGYPNQHVNGFSAPNAAPPPYHPQNVNKPYQGGYAPNNYGNNYHHPQGPPPPYSSFSQNYGGYGGHNYNPGPQMPGYFGNYVSNSKGFGGMNRAGSALTGVGIAGAGVGTLLTGLALWNLARSTGRSHHTVIYDNRGQPVAVTPSNSTEPIVDPILGDLVNCTLTINNDNSTEILAIPCAIATSFTPEANVKDSHVNNNTNDNTKCIITVVTKSNKEFMTTIPCSVLLNTATENNVTEPPLNFNNMEAKNESMASPENITAPPLTALRLISDNYNETLKCYLEPGDTRDPINPCFSVTHNLTVIPLPSTETPREIRR